MRFLTTTAFCGCFVLITSAAVAQSQAARDEAIKRYQEGSALYEHGQYEAAYVKFAEALGIVETPPVLFDLARAEQVTGRLVEAARHFKEYLALPPHPRITADLRMQATASLGQLQARLGHIAVEAPIGTLLSVDDKPVTTTGNIDVAPGTHTIVGQLGPISRTMTMECVAGQTVTASFVFDAPGPTPITGPVPVSATDTARRALAPESPTAVPSGAEGGDVRTGIWIGLSATAVVAAGVGIGFLVDAGNQRSTVQRIESQQQNPTNACNNPAAPLCAQRLSAANAESGDDHIATGMFIGGAALLAGAVSVFVWQRTSPKGAQRIVPAMWPMGGGALWVGSF